MKKSIKTVKYELETLAELLEHLNNRADAALATQKDYSERAKLDEEPRDGYYTMQAADYAIIREAILNVAENIAQGKAPF